MSSYLDKASNIRKPWARRHLLTKVPEIIGLFWVTKVLTTAMGEALSDFLVFRINPVVAVILGALGLGAGLALQFYARRYITFVYWFAVAMVAVFGTMAADVVHIVLGVPYVISSTFFAIVLALIFAAWYASERTLSIHSIYTKRREVFYWLAVLSTFALGTAVGDLTASTIGLGYLASGILFVFLIAIPAAGYLMTRRNEIFYFWFAYILTRPLGASFADWMGKPKAIGGLGLGDGHVAIYLGIVIVGCVLYLAITKADVKAD
jgi:uncharacterized membrane-anchored protein